MEQSSCVNLLCLGAQGLGLLFVAGVLYEYRALVYPHPAYLFHLHTTAAALFVLLLVCTTSWSIRAQISPKHPQRADFLRWHKNGNLVIVGLSATTACFMLYKKWSEGKGLLLLVRAPSYHSWSSLVWVASELILVVTGLIVYTPTNVSTSQVL